MTDTEIKYLVVDVESVPDAKLIAMVKFPDKDINDEDAVRAYQQERFDATGGSSDFIPVTFQYPVAICVAKVRGDFTIADIVSLDEPLFRPREMSKLFWRGVEETYAGAALVTFNGRGFDIPLLELTAYRYGIAAPNHFRNKSAARNRYSDRHIDLQDWISNYSAIRMHGGLDLLAKIIGKPGKRQTRGSDVYDMYLDGRLQDISDYCLHDVLDTYFVFLRTRVLTGELALEREQEIVREAKRFCEDNMKRIPALAEYLAVWGDWEPWP